jgi:ubiquitin-activating enzyme E1
LCLAGPRSVTLFDPAPVTAIDVGANYYLTMAQIGRPRAQSCVERLAELNPYVTVNVLPSPVLTEEIVGRFSVVVFTNTPRSELLRWGDFCHAHKPAIGFIAADVLGVAGYTFVDFGPEHVVRDSNGENVRAWRNTDWPR